MTQPEPEPVHGYTEAEIVAAEEQVGALINAGITAAVAAAVAAVLAEPIVGTVTDAIFAPIFTLWNTYTADVLVPELRRVYLGSGEMFLDTLAGTSDPVDRAARLVLAYDLDENLPLLDEPAAAWMADASNRLKNVGTIVWEEIREQLVEGVKAGDGIPELAARVEQAAGFSAVRAVKTARTEVASAANGGSITQARALGLDMDKQWEATFPTDGRTRPTHLAAHGQTVDLNDKFVVGDSLLDFPADPLGEADETINCRCAPTYVNIRRRAEVPVTAAVFDEAKHVRDGEGKFAEQAGEDLGVLASVADSYGPIVEELEWGDQSSGAADPAYGWLTLHENGDSVLSMYSEDDDTAKVVMDSGDSSAWTDLADRVESVQSMWEDADPADAEGEDERQLLDGLGTGRDGDIGVGYDKDGLINLYMVDQGKENFDIWLDGDETESLLATLAEAARLIDEAGDEEEDEAEVAASFQEAEHPRGRGGKFAKKGAPVADVVNGIVDNFKPVKVSTNGEASAYLKRRKPKLSRTAADAVDRYTGDTFVDTNRKLRAGDASDPEVKRLDSAMKPLPDDLLVRRRLTMDAFGVSNPEELEKLKGQIYSDPAYMSTSIGTPYGGDLGGVTLLLAVPKGTPGVLAAEYSRNPSEREILIGRGQRMVITSVKKNDRFGYNVSAVIVPEGTGE